MTGIRSHDESVFWCDPEAGGRAGRQTNDRPLPQPCEGERESVPSRRDETKTSAKRRGRTPSNPCRLVASQSATHHPTDDGGISLVPSSTGTTMFSTPAWRLATTLNIGPLRHVPIGYFPLFDLGVPGLMPWGVGATSTDKVFSFRPPPRSALVFWCEPCTTTAQRRTRGRFLFEAGSCGEPADVHSLWGKEHGATIGLLGLYSAHTYAGWVAEHHGGERTSGFFLRRLVYETTACLFRSSPLCSFGFLPGSRRALVLFPSSSIPSCATAFGREFQDNTPSSTKRNYSLGHCKRKKKARKKNRGAKERDKTGPKQPWGTTTRHRTKHFTFPFLPHGRRPTTTTATLPQTIPPLFLLLLTLRLSAQGCKPTVSGHIPQSIS